MESATATLPAVESERLRWRDLLPVLVFTVLGTILTLAVLLATARTNRAVYRANLETVSLLATLAIYLAAGAGVVLGLSRLRRPAEFLGLRRPTLADIGLTLALLVPWYVGIFAVALLSAFLFNGGHPVPGNSRLVFIQRPNGIGLLLLALLITSVAAPLVEETFFRGMLFRLLRSRMPLWSAVLLSAVAFGLAHASPAISLALLPTFAYMGVVLAVVYERTHRLTNTILLHGLNNALVTILAFSAALR